MLNLAHSPNDSVDNSNISQVIGYRDDALEISFKDNSTLHLSGCGANFKYVRPQNGSQPYLARRLNEVVQRCVFATSETKKKVIQALTIRNRLCRRPYVISDFAKELELEPFRLYKELEEFEWPPMEATRSSTDDGTVIVFSKEKFAQLELFPDRHKVRVSYTAGLSDSTSISEYLPPHKHDSEKKNSVHLMYTWQRLVFPASQCPDEWRYPLEVAMRKDTPVQAKPSSIPHHLSFDCKNTTRAPRSLPKKCPKQFDHKWRNSESYALSLNAEIPEGTNSGIRYLWCDGDSYWISTETTPKIEVWISNGSILKSHPTNDRYFVHSFRNLQKSSGIDNDCGGKDEFVERIMSSASIPQDLKLKSVFLRSIRLLTYSSQRGSSILESPRCWDLEDETNTNVAKTTDSESDFNYTRPDLQKNAYIQGVGNFSAVGDSIQISFDDGTMLHMFVTATNLDSGAKFSSDQCRITLKDGQYFVEDDLKHPDPKVAKYVSHVSAWIVWLSKPSEERAGNPFYVDTMYDKSKQNMVSQELDKIHRATNSQTFDRNFSNNFKYPGLTGNKGVQFMTCQDVSSALSHTNKAIKDLDQIISSFRKGNAN